MRGLFRRLGGRLEKQVEVAQLSPGKRDHRQFGVVEDDMRYSLRP
jgi:hypothetical protein